MTTANRISGYCYDSAGNLLDQTTCPANPPHAYTYNAENQLTATAGVTYTYDGDGKRVQKSNGKLYWYGMGSDPLDETDLAGNTNNSSFNEYIFFGGKRIARRDFQNNVNYYFADHLGTARIVANSSGTVLDDSDFYPFGAERPITSSSGNNYKFTGKERDPESGLDNFGARFDSSSMGRFMSPDEPFSDQNQENPQSWNLYTYARNNPLRFTDEDGRACVQQKDGTYKTAGTEGQSCEDQAAEEAGDTHIASAVVTPSHDDQIKMFAEDIGNVGTAELKQDVLIMAAGVADVAVTTYILRIGAEVEEEVAINSQKQDGHVKGTPQYKNRIKGGKSTSAFRSRKMADKLTRDTWDTGTPRPDGSRVKDYGRPIAEGPNGGTQTKVRVTQDASGQIHGTPWGPVTP